MGDLMCERVCVRAFEKTPLTKDFIIAETRAHMEADRFLKGQYWDVNIQKGCAVGCTLFSASKELGEEINKNDHSQYERLIGVPEWLAKLQDVIFEGLSVEDSKKWPLEFFKAINVGADLEKALYPILIGIVEICYNDFDHDKNPECKKAVDDVLSLLRSGETDRDRLRSAYAAARAAAYATRAAADAAYAAARAAAYAAYAAARAAADAAPHEEKRYKEIAEMILQKLRECR